MIVVLAVTFDLDLPVKSDDAKAQNKCVETAMQICCGCTLVENRSAYWSEQEWCGSYCSVVVRCECVRLVEVVRVVRGGGWLRGVMGLL